MKRLLLSLAVFLVAVLVFEPARNYELLGYDDGDYVSANVHVQHGITAEGSRWAFNCGYASNWHPLAWLSLMADAEIVNRIKDATLDEAITDEVRAGGEIAVEKVIKARYAGVMHLHNILLHGANAALLFMLLTVVTNVLGGAGGPYVRTNMPTTRSTFPVLHFTLALLWAVHPLRVEVVCWVSERKELLCVFFLLLAAMSHFRCTDKFWNCTATIVFLALALASKPVAVTFPVVMWAWDMLFRGKIRWMRLGMAATMSVACCALTLMAQTKAIAGMSELPPLTHLTTVLRAPVVYLAQTLVPWGLSMNYCFLDRIDWEGAAMGLVLLAGIVVVAIGWLKERKHGGRRGIGNYSLWDVGMFAIAWMYVGLLPMIGIVKVGNQPHSDRYTYWVGCGAVVVVLQTAIWLKRRFAKVVYAQDIQRKVFIALATAVCAYGLVSRRYMPAWHDTESLYRDSFRKSGDVELGRKLASAMVLNDKADDAEALARDLCAMCPGKAEPMLTLATVISQNMKKTDMSEAIYMARRAQEVIPDNPMVHEALGNIALRTGRLGEALKEYEIAMAKGSDNVQLPTLIEKIKDDMSTEGGNVP